jgi:hypothetical protein
MFNIMLPIVLLFNMVEIQYHTTLQYFCILEQIMYMRVPLLYSLSQVFISIIFYLH